MLVDFVQELKEQIEFSKKTFGPNYTYEGVIDHIKEELIEIEAKPEDVEEWIDVVILGWDGAWRCLKALYPNDSSIDLSIKVITAYLDKCKKNAVRSWPDWKTAEPGKAIKHIKEHEIDHDLIRFEGEGGPVRD